jgi:hypothetical protein
VQAIRERKLLEITYNNIRRTVEPYTYGITKNKHEMLRCYQIKGKHSSIQPHDWDFLKVIEIKSLSISEESFLGNRPEYKKDDKAFDTIYAQI